MLSTAAPSVLVSVARCLPTALKRASRASATDATAASRISEIQDDEHFAGELKQLADADKLAVFDFTARWCGPCRAIAPLYEQLASRYPAVQFYKVDIDNPKLERTVADHAVSAVPTFTFYKGTQRLDSFQGAQVDLLKQLLQKHASAVSPDSSG